MTYSVLKVPLNPNQPTIVASRLDYCNAMLYGAPANAFDVLQRAQNNLARVVCQHGGRTDAKPLLQSLHWLPVKQRVTYKMATLTFKVEMCTDPKIFGPAQPGPQS